MTSRRGFVGLLVVCPLLGVGPLACTETGSAGAKDAGAAGTAAAGSAGTSGSAGTAAAGASGMNCGVPTSFQWTSSGPLLSPVSDAAHDIGALKDPTIVFFNGEWRVYATSVTPEGVYGMVSMGFADFAQAGSASTYYMDQTAGFSGYHVAPQLFFFTPQNKWYLVYQSGPPQYSTSDDPANPASWTTPASFFTAEPPTVTANKGATGGWLDFWVICDSANCFLFFSDDNGTFYRSQTSITDFPMGFGDPVVVMKDAEARHLFEASNVYRMKDTGKYLAMIEAFDAGSSYKRYFRSWTADALDGEWTPLQDTFAAPFASTANVSFDGAPWTSDISHGEMLRDGYDETLTIDTCNLRFLYQGYDPTADTSVYNKIPWRLGLLTKTN